MLSGQPSAASVKQHLAQLKQAGATIKVARRSEILAACLEVRGVAKKPSDLLVCAFSSHGFNEKRQAFVMPGDGVKDLLSDTAISLDSIETSLETSKAGPKLLLVDACQERISAKAMANAGVAMSPAFQDALKRPTGQAKLASCSPGEFSYEHASLGGVGHGIFTHSFLEALRGGAKVDAQNFVCLGSVADYVSSSVTDWTKEAKRKPQTPFMSGPATSQKLPLALKADDLATLIAGVKRQPVSALFTADLRTRLVEKLAQLNPQQEADRELLSETRNFVRGSYPERLFVPYLKEDMQRWRGTTPPLLVAPFTN